jgi:AraC family transcriptional regulator
MKANTLQDYKQRLLPVLVHIQQRVDEPLDLETLAGLAHFSPFHFHRIFRGMMGESLQEHIRRLRMERAAWRLRFSQQTIVQIALDAGYDSHEAFTRAFKVAFGMAPSRFRILRQPRRLVIDSRVPSGVHYREDTLLTNFKTMKPNPKNETITIQKLKDLRVAFVRHVGPYAGCGQAWEKLCAYLGKEGMLGGNARFIGLCHDDPEVTPASKIRYDACVTVDEDFKPEGEIGVQVITGGDFAVTTHYGPYERLYLTYSRVMGQWIPRSGREASDGPSLEFYQNDPGSTAPQDLLTDVYVRLK